MLYLEDFLELIESFPVEIKEKLSKIREIDQQVLTEGEKIETKASTFFAQCKRQKNTEWRNEQYEGLVKEYNGILEKSDDKIQIATQLSDLIEKYLKKLDQEIHKFKLELEADNAGITSKLERAVQLNQNYDFNEENYYGSNLFDDKSQLFDFQLSSAGQAGSEPFLNSPAASYDPFNLFYNYPSGANAQLSPTNSLLSSTAVGHTDVPKRAGGMKRSSAAVRAVSSSASLSESPYNLHSGRQKRLKLERERDEDNSGDGLSHFMDEATRSEAGDDGTSECDGDSATTATTADKHLKEELNSNEDPNEEQRYCLCKDVSYGDMILCDNTHCKTQWFHFICVGLSSAPKGKWFCPSCANIRKKRKEKQQQQLQQLNQQHHSVPPLHLTNDNSQHASDFLTPATPTSSGHHSGTTSFDLKFLNSKSNSHKQDSSKNDEANSF